MVRGRKRKKGGVACPICNQVGTHCTDSRPIRGGIVTMRRRHCGRCNRRFTTYERVASASNMPDRSFEKRVEVALTAAQTAFERLSEMQMILSEIKGEDEFQPNKRGVGK